MEELSHNISMILLIAKNKDLRFQEFLRNMGQIKIISETCIFIKFLRTSIC